MMKRFLAPVLALLFLLTGCAADTARRDPPAATKSAAPATEASPVFTFGGTHRATADYGQVFTFRTAANEACILNIETRVFNEEQAARLWETVTDDLKTIAANVPVKQTMPEIYIVQKALHGAAERIGFYIYCTAEDVESGAYREALVCATLGIDPLASWWKTRGITAFAFGETADEQLLRTYYQQATDKELHVLSLFPAYFVEEFASERELSLAHETALSLTAYIVKKYGAETFLAENGSDSGCRQEWLTALGVDRIYSDPYAEALAGYSYTFSSHYPFIVITDKLDVFNLQPMESSLETPEQIMSFLYETKTAIGLFFDAVEEHAPEHLGAMLENYRNPITYSCMPDEPHSSANVCGRAGRISNIRDTLHETIHILVPPNDPEEQWKSEAIAEYFPYTFYPPLREQGLAYKTDMEVNLRNPLLGSATSTLSVFERYALTGQSLPQSEGNDLSYRDAYLFAGYLSEKYSFSTFLGFCLGTKSFKEVFGTTLAREKEAWHAFILAK